MTKSKLAVVIVILGSVRTLFSVFSHVLGIKAGTSTVFSDLIVIVAVATLALIVWKQLLGHIYILIIGGGIGDLMIRGQLAYGKFIQLPMVLGNSLSSERKIALLWWGIFEMLPGAILWITALIMVSAYKRTHSLQTSSALETPQ